MIKCIVKFGRRTYKISEKDIFMDNGSCVLLLTQTYYQSWQMCYPKVSKAVVNKWKKNNIFYTTPALEDYVKTKYKNRTNLYMYHINIVKLAELGYETIDE